MTPYEAIYGKQSPSLTTYLQGTSKVHVVDTLLQNHEWTFATPKDNLSMAQNHMKQQAYQHHSEQSFEVGDIVFL